MDEKREAVMTALQNLHKAVMELWPETKTYTATYYSGIGKVTLTPNMFSQANVYDAYEYLVSTEVNNVK